MVEKYIIKNFRLYYFFFDTKFSYDYVGIRFTGISGSFDAGAQSIGLDFDSSSQITLSGTVTLSVYYF